MRTDDVTGADGTRPGGAGQASGPAEPRRPTESPASVVAHRPRPCNRRTLLALSGDAEALVRLGRTAMGAWRPDEALACLDAALLLRPYAAEAHYLRGEVLHLQRRIGEALASYTAAERLGIDRDPDAQKSYMSGLVPGDFGWMGAMLLGDFERAWAIGDRALHRCAPSARGPDRLPPHLRPVWDGSPLAGRTVLVRCYRGLGDTIQFIRYAPLLSRIANAVIVQAQPQLVPLLASVSGIDRLVPLGEAPEPPHDVDIEVMELPHAFRTTLATIPATAPYLEVASAPARAERHPFRRNGRFRVGLVWAAGSSNWRQRSVPLSCFAPLNRVPNVALFSLQHGPEVAQLRGSSEDLPRIVHRDDLSDDVVETATRILSLDLVISVDTMVAHLAGALGAPVWTLLPFGADWRWLLDREDSPWYPTMRLFRQPRPGDWRAPVERIARELSSLAAAHTAGDGREPTSAGRPARPWPVLRAARYAARTPP